MSNSGQMETPEYVHLIPENSLPQLDGSPFKAVLVIESDATADWREKVCDWLVRGGCRYAMTWGTECEAWHDSIDSANFRKFGDTNIPDEFHIMTTWHDKDSLKEVFRYSETCAFHETLELNPRILHIAREARKEELLALYGSVG